MWCTTLGTNFFLHFLAWEKNYLLARLFMLKWFEPSSANRGQKNNWKIWLKLCFKESKYKVSKNHRLTCAVLKSKRRVRSDRKRRIAIFLYRKLAGGRADDQHRRDNAPECTAMDRIICVQQPEARLQGWPGEREVAAQLLLAAPTTARQELLIEISTSKWKLMTFPS